MFVFLPWRNRFSSLTLSKTFAKYEAKHINFSLLKSADRSGEIYGAHYLVL